jgi:hypothetical protein
VFARIYFISLPRKNYDLVCFYLFIFYFDLKLIPPPLYFFLFSNFFLGWNFDGYQNSVQKALLPGGGVWGGHVLQPTLDDKIKDDGCNKTEIRFKQRNDFGFIVLVFIGGISKSKMSLFVFYFF